MTGVNLGTLFASLLLEDDFSGTFKKYLDEQDKALKKANDVANGFKVAGTAITAFGTASVAAAAKLNKSMANVATLIPGNTERIKELKSSVQDMSIALGKSTDDLSEGLYEVISSLGDTSDTLKILEINAKAGAAGLASTQDALKFTSAVTKTYGDTSAEAFQKVSDLGFQAVNLGQTTFPELAGAIGRVAPLAKETGVSMEEMFAIIATATGVTGNTNEVITQMSAAITAVVSPTKDLSEAYEAMGIKSGEALIRQEGLAGALQKLAKYAKDTEKPFIDLVGRKEAWVIASSLAGAQAENLTQKMAAMQKVAGSTDTAFKEQTQGIAAASHQWEIWKNTVTVALQKTGDAILDHMNPALQAAAIGFSEMAGKAIASAGELSQVALAAKALGAGNAVASIGNLTSGLTGLTGAAGAARLGLIGIGIAVAAWSFAKVYEAISLMGELQQQVDNTEKDMANAQRQWSQLIENAHTKVGISAKNAAEAFEILRVYSAGLRNELPKEVQWTDNLTLAFERGMVAGGHYAEQTKNVMITTQAMTGAIKETKPHIDTMVDQLNRVKNEVAHFTDAQKKQISAGKEMQMNAKDITAELNKLPGAAKVSEAAVQMFLNSIQQTSKATKETNDDIKKLREQMMGLGSVMEAGNLSKAFGSNVSLIDPTQIDSALTTLRAALDTIDRLGTKAAGVTDSQVTGWRDLSKALQVAQNRYAALDAEFKNLASGGIKKVDDRVSHFTETTEELGKELKKLKDRMSDRSLTEGLSKEFGEVVSKTREFQYELEGLGDSIANELNPALRAQITEYRNLRALEMGKELGDMVVKTDEYRNALLALVPLFPSLAGAIVDVGNASDGAEGKTRKFRREVESLKDAFTGEIGANFFEGVINTMVSGFKEGKITEAFEGVGNSIISQISKGMAANAAKAFGGGTMGAIAGGMAGAGAGLILGLAFQEAMWHATRGEQEQKMREAADQMRTQIFGQVANGNDRLFAEMLRRAGQTSREIQVIMETGDPEQLSRTWDGAARALQGYNTELKGLETAASGANLIAQSLAKSLGESMKAQQKPFDEAQKMMLEAMEAADATSAEIAAQQAKFTEENKNRVFAATEEQIAQYNRLGTITGGVIANMAGRTGDLVGAIMSNKDAIEQLIEAQTRFGLAGENTSAATQKVIDLYKQISDNEDVYTSIQGVTQGLTGFGDAMVRNAELANAFGGELAADLNTLVERGVSIGDAYASAAIPLQRLWEIQQEGEVQLDATTTAMLAQAEAQGVVGENMRDTNEKILEVLKEIRDMFSDELPHAVQRTTQAVQTGANAQQRAAAQTAQAWKDGSQDVAETWKRQGAEIERQSAQTVVNVSAKLRTIPKDFPIKVDWKIPPLDLPDAKPYEIPVEFDYDGPVWQENYPGTPPTMGDSGYEAASAVTPASMIDGGRGTQTIIVERDGQKDLQFTAENLPDYVRIRAGNTVLGV